MKYEVFSGDVFLNFFICFSQKCGIATYDFKILDSEDTQSPLFDILRADSELIEISLHFNQNYSLYEIKKLEGSTNLAREIALATILFYIQKMKIYLNLITVNLCISYQQKNML
ncbi:hypothetical protein [Flavobacterium sp. I3-2]|uniref:hypothetical protein n=1 Tax=Flavobacterium sp. I3-2 TaxID=2748319 RepID=UPI0015AD9C02|nr:hypothetical protein [Flavobacterium sp. I3-2]